MRAGQPIYLDKALIHKYKESKREACTALLGSVRDGMRSVIVAAADYKELTLIHTVRRLYQRPASGITTGDKQVRASVRLVTLHVDAASPLTSRRSPLAHTPRTSPGASPWVCGCCWPSRRRRRARRACRTTCRAWSGAWRSTRTRSRTGASR